MKPAEISKKTGQPLETIRVDDLPPLPPPYENYEEQPITELKEDQKERWSTTWTE